MQWKLCRFAMAAVVLGSLSVSAAEYPDDLPEQQKVPAVAPLEAVAGPKEKGLIEAVFANDRTRLELLHDQVDMARKALIAKLLSPDKNVDVTREVTQMKQAHDALLEERVKLALRARAIMSTQELAQASQLWTKLEDLHGQERALFDTAGHQSPGGQ
jgi:hypothetical protein